jgi:arylsulfatase
VLKTAGYRTAMSGKWHLCRADVREPMVNHATTQPFWTDKNGWPRQRGFDSFYGTIIGVEDYFDPFTLTRGNEPILDPPPKDFYYTDAITDEAVAQLRAGGEQPLFMYVAYTAPHWPLHAREEDIAKYANAYRDGWDKLRETRRKKMIELGIIDANAPLPPREPEVMAWDDAPNHEWEARRMAVYAAQIDRMDQGIGRILEAVKQSDRADNTLIIFLSDNGGCAENVQGDWFDIPSKTRDGRAVAVGNSPDVSPGAEETFQSYGPAWAMASNTPFRRYKHFAHEGGIAAPCIIRWPKRKLEGGVDSSVHHVIDIMPTLIDLTEATYPPDKTPLEGGSLFRNHPDRGICFEHEGNRAIRRKQWKLVAEYNKPWELYDLNADRGETKNLAADHPDRVRDLSAEYERWAKRCNVLPWDEVKKAHPSTSSSGSTRR